MLTVADDGPGIRDVAKELFTPFFYNQAIGVCGVESHTCGRGVAPSWRMPL